MPNPSDRRVRKTRAQLRTALEQLLQTKPVHEITVKELCAQCDINRGTFYLHYPDVAALLAAVEAELLDEFERVLSSVTAAQLIAGTPRSPSAAMCGLADFLAQNAGMCRALLCNNADMAFVERVKDVVRTQMAAEWSSLAVQDPHHPSGYAFAFVVTGCIGMLQLWLENDMPLSAREMATLLETIPAKGIVALLG